MDFIWVGLLLWSAWNGFQKGFWLSLAGLGGILIGIWIGIEMSDWIDWHKDSIALRIVSFLSVFICSLFLMNLAARLIQRLVYCRSFGILDGLLGALLSICSWGGLISVALSILSGTLYLSQGPVGHFLEETGSWILKTIRHADPTQALID